MGEKVNKVIIIIMGVILAILVGLSVVLFLYLKPKPVEVVPPNTEKTEIVSIGDAITTNIRYDQKSEDATNMVKATVSLTIENVEAKFTTMVTERMLEIRSEIAKIIRSKTKKELDFPDAQEKLEKEIAKKLNKIYNTNKILGVNTEIVTQ